ncbi:MAG: gliding motility lipoprotein GldH [Bacteroidetes bacterium]|nr:gliding motility lipoprotein GldH [Bacteroidota bacterium]
MVPVCHFNKLSFQKIFLSFLILISGAFFSCDRSRLFEDNILIEQGSWNVKKPAVFDVEISELNRRYNIYLNVRNSPDYQYSNLFLFLTTSMPDGKKSRDTLELTLADYDGRWLGSGMGSVKFSRFLLKKGLQFTQKGKYRFELEQAMRVNELPGIRDIGMRIEKQ